MTDTKPVKAPDQDPLFEDDLFDQIPWEIVCNSSNCSDAIWLALFLEMLEGSQ